jgi:hypothetical protein
VTGHQKKLFSRCSWVWYNLNFIFLLHLHQNFVCVREGVVVCIFSFYIQIRNYPLAFWQDFWIKVEILDFWLFSCISFSWRLSRWSHFGFLHFSRRHFQFYVHHLSIAETSPEKKLSSVLMLLAINFSPLSTTPAITLFSGIFSLIAVVIYCR